ncbi:MAG: lysine--tRNA ligase, partial [Pseudomonadota bacterium]|nr:lysine--tRNA ligase [Pseudomonadota bacterium]
FAEVVRTTMVRRAFAELCDIPTRLICFSDDMDGLRKVPENVPNRDMMEEYLGRPLTEVPDPFGEYESFGGGNNARLRKFLDSFGFEYEFVSSTKCYRAGRFDTALQKMLDAYDDIMAIMLPTLGSGRQATYSPFLPISPSTGRVLQVPVTGIDAKAGTVRFTDEDGTETELPVAGGHCKLQWKPDWAMRWYALDVDYEMHGKDLIDSVKLGERIVRRLGGRPPEMFTYELFLDEQGHKISKSKGNGLTMEEWLSYAPPESLAYFMYQHPRKAKRLYFDVIPRAVDEYLSHLARLPEQDDQARRENPAWHVTGGAPVHETVPISFNILLNLASVVNAKDKSVLWGYIARYVPGADAKNWPMLDRLADHAVAYYRDFISPQKTWREPTRIERDALEDLAETLTNLSSDATPEDIQNAIYAIGKRHAFEPLRDWFKAMYEVLLGQSEGPRMGPFIAIYGIESMIVLIREKLAVNVLRS